MSELSGPTSSAQRSSSSELCGLGVLKESERERETKTESKQIELKGIEGKLDGRSWRENWERGRRDLGVFGEKENGKAGERKRAENEGNKGQEGGNLVRI